MKAAQELLGIAPWARPAQGLAVDLEHRHQVRLPLISSRGRLQIGCGIDCPLGGAQHALLSQDEHLVEGWGSSWATRAQGDDAVDALGGLVLGGFQVAGGSWATATLAAIQRVTWVAAMGNFARDDQLLELTRGGCHGAEALAESQGRHAEQ